MGLLHHKRFFRPDEAASILALSRRTVYRMIRDGRITGVKWGKGPWRIPRDSLAILLGDYPESETNKITGRKS